MPKREDADDLKNDLKKKPQTCPCHYWREECDKKQWACERLNLPFWSFRAAVCVQDFRQWHMRDISVARRERQRSLVLCKNEDTSFSISASLSTDRHANTNPHKDIRTQSHTGDIHFSIRARKNAALLKRKQPNALNLNQCSWIKWVSWHAAKLCHDINYKAAGWWSPCVIEYTFTAFWRHTSLQLLFQLPQHTHMVWPMKSFRQRHAMLAYVLK